MIKGYGRRGRRRAFTLVELLCVIIILSSVIAISYPSMVTYYHRQRLSTSALEVSYELSGARSLSINRVDDRVYGVLFERDGSYRTVSFERGRRINLDSSDGAEASGVVSEKKYLRPGVSLRNFEKPTGGPAITIIFRADGVPTENAVDFPLPDDLASLTFQSSSTQGEVTIRISKTTGINTVE